MVAPAGLDVLTPRGQRADATAQRVAQGLAASWGMVWGPTPRDRPAAVDGVFLRLGTVAAVAECKVRQHTRAEMAGWGDTYLITHHKLEQGRQAAELLRVPFLLCVYLEPDGMAYWWKIATPEGRWAFEFSTHATTTQRTVNGGRVVRMNAFLPFAQARVAAV